MRTGPIVRGLVRRCLCPGAVIVALACLPMVAWAGASEGKKVAFLLTGPAIPFPAAMKTAFVEHAKELGQNVTIFEQNFDVARQAQQMDDAIARKFDIIVVMPASEQAIVPALTRAKSAGIPVIILNSPPKDGTEALYTSFIGEDAVEMGRLAGLSIEQALKDAGRDGGKVALITGALQEGVGPRRLVGLKEVLDKDPKIKIVAVEDAHWNPVEAERIAGQLFARFAPQGGVDVIYGMNDDLTVAIVRAADAAKIPLGLKPGRLIVTGGNCMKADIEMIKDGREYSTGLQVPTRTGRGAADLVEQYFAGKELKKLDYLPIETITKANLAKWEAPCNY